ncbi:MAG: diaminopimelate epimerase [Chlamydiae bacterium]|nr:MAG: diaminopimelate epimerase [Chlamydiota bacterium]
MNFTKMHGCGNDFVVIDATADLKKWNPSLNEAAFLLDRHFGIGGDQLLIIYPSEIADMKMAIFNPDGSEVEMCGNGIRCCALYAKNHGLVDKNEMTVETLAGIIKPVIEDECVRVDMGEPKLNASEIPVIGLSGHVINIEPPKIESNFNLPKMTCVSMGNPHTVFFVNDVNAVPLENIGKKVETNSIFPNKTNVEFVQILNVKTVKMRVWERGAGITLACGTGACGTVVAGILSGKLEKNVTVILDGGELNISWNGVGTPVFMTGPAEEVFSGKIENYDK